MDFKELEIDLEGGENMRDIFFLHNSELGEIIWQHKSGASSLQIAQKLKVKKWQVEQYIKKVESRI